MCLKFENIAPFVPPKKSCSRSFSRADLGATTAVDAVRGVNSFVTSARFQKVKEEDADDEVLDVEAEKDADDAMLATAGVDEDSP